MKRIISLILCLMIMAGMTAALAESNQIVLCFSATDNTWAIAEQVAALTGADLLRIEPEVPYTDDDINWRVDDCRANLEQQDDTCRPGIANLPESLDDYDTVFLGFPIWWGTIPQIIKTLVENYDWEGKTIVPFCTSGSSGIATAISDLKALDSGAEVLETGRRFSAGASEDEIGAWLQEIGY